MLLLLGKLNQLVSHMHPAFSNQIFPKPGVVHLWGVAWVFLFLLLLLFGCFSPPVESIKPTSAEAGQLAGGVSQASNLSPSAWIVYDSINGCRLPS